MQWWLRVQTQWRTGLAGATGLDYPGVEAALRLARVPRAQWPALFVDLQAMELAFLGECARERGR